MDKSLRNCLAVLLLAAVVALGACTGGVGDSSESADAGADSAAGADDRSAAGDSSTGPVGANRSQVRTKAVILTAEIDLTSEDLDDVRADVQRLLTAMGGSVDNETTTNDSGGRVERSTLVLRVPVDRFRGAKEALERLGRLRSSDQSRKDVTTEVIDVDERVQTLQNSLDRLQRFQRQATDVGDLLRYEDQITQRQSELQSLTAQQSYLADQTSMATITLHLSTPAAAPPGALDDAGFVTGLVKGWHALGDVVVVGLTVLGAVLPFLVAGSLLLVPGWWLWRGLLRRRSAAGPEPTEP
jgi:hypothetical protein